jgi:ribonuclease Z
MPNLALVVCGLVSTLLLVPVGIRATIAPAATAPATIVPAAPAPAALASNAIVHAQPPVSPSGAAEPVPADGLRVTLLGTGVGPPVNLTKYGASTLVEAGGLRLLFDCGRGATIRLTEAGIPLGSISRLFLTHLHSDHVMQIPDLLLAGWVVADGRTTPLDVWGPKGTQDMMAALEKAFAFDIHMRRDVDEKFSAAGITLRSHDIEEGVVFEEGGVKVTAFLVDHQPIVPAFGYRVDYRGRSVVLSGDTRVSENLIRFAKGADVLVHEAVDPVASRASSRDPVLIESIITHHTTGEQAGQVFARVNPRLAVFSHAPTSDALLAQARQHYSGRLEGAEDLLTIDIADQITVRRFRR